MERLTFEGDFCDIAQCAETRGGSFCESGACSQRKTWERLKAYEDTGLTPERCAELAQADKEGRLVVLPCKVGDMPADDVAPVRHERWDDSGKYIFPGGSKAIVCTGCGCALTPDEYQLNRWNYCPVCGAKMDGGADNG